MTEVLESVIVGESRHFFIYGKNGEERAQLLKSIADKYPIVLDASTPACVYMEDFALPVVTNPVDHFDKLNTLTCAREFLSFAITHQLVSQFLRKNNIWDAKERVDQFIKRANRILKGHDYNDIKDLEDLIGCLKISKEFYSEEYKNLLQLGTTIGNTKDLPIPFMTLTTFMEMFKRMINTNSYFSLIFDQQTPIPLISQQAINSIVTRRINSDISMNVVCDRDEWETYYGLDGMLAEPTHDYGDRNLEDLAPGFQKVK